MRLTIGSTELYYEERGDGVPLLNLHGWPAEHGQMVAMMEPLFEGRTGWRRIYVDLPGMGLSSAPASVTSHDQLLEVVSELVEHVATEERLVIAGHSYGARLALGLMHRYGDRIAGALLLSPGGSAGEGETDQSVVFAEDPQFDAQLTATERGVVDLIRVRTMEVLDILRRQALPGLEAADHAFLTRIASSPDFSYLADPVAPFPGPVLVLSGRQDPAGYRHLCDLVASYPRGTLAILDRAGHLLFAEQPTLMRALTTEWLDRVEEFVSSAGEPADGLRE